MEGEKQLLVLYGNLIFKEYKQQLKQKNERSKKCK